MDELKPCPFCGKIPILYENKLKRRGTGERAMDKLKPCPFCGGEARTGFAINDYNRWGVECTRCGATVEVADWCGDCDTEENAIKAWNRRVKNDA